MISFLVNEAKGVYRAVEPLDPAECEFGPTGQLQWREGASRRVKTRPMAETEVVEYERLRDQAEQPPAIGPECEICGQ